MAMKGGATEGKALAEETDAEQDLQGREGEREGGQGRVIIVSLPVVDGRTEGCTSKCC